MSSPQLDDDKLQRYFDGELAESEAQEVRLAIEESEQEQARLTRLERLRDLMRMAADDAALELGSDDLYAKVREGIAGEERAGRGEGLRVVAGGRSERAAPSPKRRRAVVGVGMGLALAAAVALAWLARPSEPEAPVAEEQSAPEEPTAPAPEQGEEQGEKLAVVEEAPGGSEVVEVDFGRNTGTVFEVQGEAGEPIAVVWINDEEAL